MWARIIRSRHGSPSGKSGSIYENLGKGKKGWWRKIISMVEGVENG